MNRDDLKPGMTIETRNGEKYAVEVGTGWWEINPEKFSRYFRAGQISQSAKDKAKLVMKRKADGESATAVNIMQNYEIDMSRIGSSSLDIVRIYSGSGSLLWERKKIIPASMKLSDFKPCMLVTTRDKGEWLVIKDERDNLVMVGVYRRTFLRLNDESYTEDLKCRGEYRSDIMEVRSRPDRFGYLFDFDRNSIHDGRKLIWKRDDED